MLCTASHSRSLERFAPLVAFVSPTQARMRASDMEADLERTRSRAAKVKEALHEQEQNAIKTDVVSALRRFFAAGEKLRKVNVERAPMVAWCCGC